LLLLAALYDQSTGEPIERRWSRLRRRSGFRPLWSRRDLQIGFGTTLVVAALIATFPSLRGLSVLPWLLLPILLGWLYWGWRLARAEWFAKDIRKGLRVLSRDPAALRWELLWFKPSELGGQPMPTSLTSGGEERYELLRKFQAVLTTLGYAGIVVLVDRVDEPHLVNGSVERMRDLLWPMFDNKFLKHPGIGFKLLLPIEVSFHLAREDREFFERSRLDKQNLIRSLQWTGESLYDVANDRIRACADLNNGKVAFRNLFDESVSEGELIATLERLRVPRHLFKFVYRLLVDHCNRYTDDNPRWTIARETLQSTLALYLRDLQEFDRGLGTG